MANIFTAKWKVIRTIWPYKDGYGVYKEDWFGNKTILHTGLSKEQAQVECEKLNNQLTNH